MTSSRMTVGNETNEKLDKLILETHVDTIITSPHNILPDKTQCKALYINLYPFLDIN